MEHSCGPDVTKNGLVCFVFTYSLAISTSIYIAKMLVKFLGKITFKSRRLKKF